MPRGGRRTPTPGKAYPNRSDMRAQPVRTAPSQTYGDAAASERAQKAVPLPQAPPAPGAGAAAAAGMPAPAAPLPGEMPLNRPSDRPGEPVTAGLPIGAGPGPSATMPAMDPVVETLRAAYRAFPNEATASLLEAMGG